MKNKNKSNLIAESNSGLLLGEISSKNISAQVLDSDEVFESYFEDAKNLTAEVVGSEVIGFVEGDTITGEVQLSIGDFEFIKGPIGKAGPEGKGVPAGGNDGDVLVKVGQENYVTRWERPRFGGGGRQSSSPSGSSNYTGASPTTVTVGGLPAGSAIAGLPISDILEDILVAYLSPAFSSFSIGQSSPIEVGATISGFKNFSFGFSNSGNVNADSLSIEDVTGSSTLGSGLPITSPQSLDIGSISYTTPTTHSWRGTAVNSQSDSFQSALASVSWLFRIFYGTSANATLTEAQIEALSNSPLASSENATYSFGTGGYKYWAWPDSFGSPTASTGFKDTATNLAVAMASAVDDAAYSNTENGWSYALVSVTNPNGVTVNYRVYRTKFVLGGAINVEVS